MAIRNYEISSILGGQQATEILGGEGQFLASRGIDPDISRAFSNDAKYARASGFITPVVYSDKVNSSIDARVVAIVKQPQTSSSFIYAVLKNGKIFRYTVASGAVALSGESSIGTVTGSNAEGAFYYNDYLYITGTGASKNDISRYGPLSGTPSLTNGVWTGSTLGSQTALADHDMPGDFPKHWGHVHTDGQVYFADFVSGQGVLHAIKTDNSGSNDGTEYNVLDLPFGYRITSIESFGTDLIIGAVQTTDEDAIQGRAALFLWDTTNDVSFYRQIEVPAPFISALAVKNGTPYVFYGFSADAEEGLMIGTYTGGYSIRMIDFQEGGRMPLAGAVGTYGNRLLYANGQELYALGYKSPRVGSSNARHSIALVSNTTSGEYINAIATVFQPSGTNPRFVLGTNSSIEEEDTIDANLVLRSAIFRSEMIHVGQQFTINKIAVPLDNQINADTDIEVRVHYDNGDNSVTLPTINNTNYSTGKKRVVFKQREITGSATGGTVGYVPYYNFFIEITLKSNDPVMLPILLQVDTIDD